MSDFGQNASSDQNNGTRDDSDSSTDPFLTDKEIKAAASRKRKAKAAAEDDDEDDEEEGDEEEDEYDSDAHGKNQDDVELHVTITPIFAKPTELSLHKKSSSKAILIVTIPAHEWEEFAPNTRSQFIQAGVVLHNIIAQLGAHASLRRRRCHTEHGIREGNARMLHARHRLQPVCLLRLCGGGVGTGLGKAVNVFILWVNSVCNSMQQELKMATWPEMQDQDWLLGQKLEMCNGGMLRTKMIQCRGFILKNV